MVTVGRAARSFIDLGDNVVAILRAAFYSIEDQPVKGHRGEHGTLYEPDESERELLRDAAQQLYWRSKDLLPDGQRDRIRKAVAAAIKLIVSWKRNRCDLRDEEQAYAEQETLQTASTLIIEASGDIVKKAKKSTSPKKRPDVKGAVKNALADHPRLKHYPANLEPYVLKELEIHSPGYKRGPHFSTQVRQCVREILRAAKKK
jgi:hypothetical protein